MTLCSEQSTNLIASQRIAQGSKAFAHRRQGHFRVRLPGLCTDSLHTVVGQSACGGMGQAAQVEVSLDGIPAQSVCGGVIAQPQVAPQLFEQYLDRPMPLVNQQPRKP